MPASRTLLGRVPTARLPRVSSRATRPTTRTSSAVLEARPALLATSPSRSCARPAPATVSAIAATPVGIGVAARPRTRGGPKRPPGAIVGARATTTVAVARAAGRRSKAVVGAAKAGTRLVACLVVEAATASGAAPVTGARVRTLLLHTAR